MDHLNKGMIYKYKLDKIAGPSGTFAGYVLFIFGIITTVFSLTGILVLLLGAFLAFCYNCSEIDPEKRNVLSGIMISRWYLFWKNIEIDDSYKLEIKHVKAKYSVYSSSNRKLDINQKDYRIYIFSSIHLNRTLLAKFDDLTEAQNEAEKIKNLIRVDIELRSW
jgi:hypothetical protein